MRLVIAAVYVLLSLTAAPAAHAQSVRTVTFRVPVEVENVRYLSSVRVDCRIQDGTRQAPLDMPDWSNSHSVSKRVTVFILDGHSGACTAEPRTEDAAYRCADSTDAGKSWSKIVEVPVRDYEGGAIRVGDGQKYKCITEVSYDTEPERAGEATLADANCVGFFENTWSITARERYQTYTGGDIHDASLCTRTDFNASLSQIDVPAQYIRAGECCAETPTAEEADAPATTPATGC